RAQISLLDVREPVVSLRGQVVDQAAVQQDRVGAVAGAEAMDGTAGEGKNIVALPAANIILKSNFKDRVTALSGDDYIRADRRGERIRTRSAMLRQLAGIKAVDEVAKAAAGGKECPGKHVVEPVAVHVSGRAHRGARAITGRGAHELESVGAIDRTEVEICGEGGLSI